jgi:ribosome-associated protein
MEVGCLSAEATSLTASIVQLLLDRKAEDVTVLDISEVSLIADYFVICTCRSTPHMKTLDEALDETADELGSVWHKKEGSADAGWILHDFSSAIVHLFLSEQREYYSLDRLWRDAKKVPVESLLSQQSAPQGEARAATESVPDHE